MRELEGKDFDNILLIPRVNDMESREDVSLQQTIGSLTLDIPIILSPMKGISNRKMVELMSDAGGIGILHRFYDDYDLWKDDIAILSRNNKRFGVAIGLNENKKLEYVLTQEPSILCIDVANGYIKSVRDYLEYVNKMLDGSNILLMAGNVVEQHGYNSLATYADIIRVGIGSGTLCTTRKVTGVGIPQITAIASSEIGKIGVGRKSWLVADGGIRNSGDIVKALWAGADLVMMGSYFGHAIESPNNGTIYGMASRRLQEEYYHNTKSVEGIEKEIQKTKPFSELIDEVVWGIKSAFTYLGVRNIYELQRRDIEFVNIY